MKSKLKRVQCGNCKFFVSNAVYKSEGNCSKDNEYTRAHIVCDKLPTDHERLSAKINKQYRPLIVIDNI